MRKTLLALCWLGICSGPVAAQGSQIARETVEFMAQRFGRQAVRKGAEVLARRIEGLAAKHGNEVFQAVRKVGPNFFQVVEHAGEHAGRAVGIMARHGEPGVAWVLKRPKGMALVLTHGEEAAKVLVRHPGGICEPVIEHAGKPAIKALQSVGSQNARRMGMMLSDGELAKIGRTPELMDVVFRFGDKAMQFIWTNKGSLAVGAALTAFLVNPEPFINGARDLTKIAAENAIRPVAEIPGQVAREAASSVNWTLLAIVGLLGILAILMPFSWKFLRFVSPRKESGSAVHSEVHNPLVRDESLQFTGRCGGQFISPGVKEFGYVEFNQIGVAGHLSYGGILALGHLIKED